MTTPQTRLVLKPTPGFVVKTTSLEPGIYTARTTSIAPRSSKSLEPTPQGIQAIAVTAGHKIFVNVAFDASVPPPPDASEANIRKAMAGDETAYIVPVVVSDGREMADKAGKPSLVFDVVFNESLRARTSKDADYKTFIIEMALERIEEKSELTLGREIGTPNIKSKGALEERTVLVPSSWLPETKRTPLIQEISPTSSTSTKPDAAPLTIGVASKPTANVESAPPLTSQLSPSNGKAAVAATTLPKNEAVVPKWTLQLENAGPRQRSARIEVEIPLMTRADFAAMTLDVERQRLILTCGPKYATLDVPILAASSGKDKVAPQLGLDVNSAKAQWLIDKGLLVITAAVLS